MISKDAMQVAYRLADAGYEVSMRVTRDPPTGTDAGYRYLGALTVSAVKLSVDALRQLVELLDGNPDIQVTILNGDLKLELS